MIYLKKVNYEDIDQEYEAIKKFPANENGFENKYWNVTKEEFEGVVIPTLLKHSEGIDLPDGYVPDTYFFLWDDNIIVGLFKIRHYLNDFLKNCTIAEINLEDIEKIPKDKIKITLKGEPKQYEVD